MLLGHFSAVDKLFFTLKNGNKFPFSLLSRNFALTLPEKFKYINL